MSELVVVGSINVDFVARVARLPRAGETVAGGTDGGGTLGAGTLGAGTGIGLLNEAVNRSNSSSRVFRCA